MVMSWIFTGALAMSLLCALVTGRGAFLSAAVMEGAQSGISLALSIYGAICLWSGVEKLMERAGFTAFLSRILRPLLRRVFPTTGKDPILAGTLSANICANFLGLGNAATPMGIQAARRLAANAPKGVASDELCRLVVLNTASIQFLPTNVAALRVGFGCATPFDILPCVWITSICSVSAGLAAAKVMERLWRRA